LTKTPLFAQLLFSMHHRSIQKASSVKKLPYFLKILTRFGFGDIPNIYGPRAAALGKSPSVSFRPASKNHNAHCFSVTPIFLSLSLSNTVERST
jgi:hypothetical protein